MQPDDNGDTIFEAGRTADEAVPGSEMLERFNSRPWKCCELAMLDG